MEKDEVRMDPADGLPATPVGEWVRDKHALLKLYVEISRGARSKFVGSRKAGATFIDLFCAAGRSYIRNTDNFVDGSPLVAWRASADCGVPFTAIHVNDHDFDLLCAAVARLRKAGAPTVAYGGAAQRVAETLVRQLNPHALHFALIDPYKLSLPFSMMATLATMKRMDLLIHVSAMDLQRNWGRYSNTADSPLHSMAPDWHKYVRLDQPEDAARLSFIHYWVGLLKRLGFEGDVRFELIKGSKGQPLYWLVLVAKHDIAMTFWKKATQHGKTGTCSEIDGEREMTAATNIEWTEYTWNPVTGCTKVSQGCKNCYAERMARRLEAMGSGRYVNGFAPTLHWDLVDAPRTWKKPRLVFVNSMSDLFLEDVPDNFIQRVFQTMADCPQHTFQILTKRSERLRLLAPWLLWPRNVWMGVSVEDSRVMSRISDLTGVPAAVRFLSCEPLIGPLHGIPLTNIHWVIVGGESGPRARDMKEDWVRSIQQQCHAAAVPFFFKQWGGVRKDVTGRLLDGRVHEEMPHQMRA